MSRNAIPNLTDHKHHQAMNPVPLLIVMGTILVLLAVQRWLVHIGSPQNKNLHKENIPPKPQKASAQPSAIAQSQQKPPPHKHSHKLTGELSVTGLDERGINSLKALIDKKETDAISTFLAFNRPIFMEIDTYLAQQRRQRENEASPSSTQAPFTTLLEPLTKTERKLLIEFNPKSTRLVSRDLMSRFGGHEFGIYFGHYAARPQSVTLHISPLDPDRKIMEDLAKSRIARKGRHIPLSARLTVLKMSQLRQMAKDLKLDKKFTRKQAAADTLATVPGAAVLLSMQYVIDDLFMLMPIKEDVILVKHEWSYLQAYAKMLSGLKL